MGMWRRQWRGVGEDFLIWETGKPVRSALIIGHAFVIFKYPLSIIHSPHLRVLRGERPGAGAWGSVGVALGGHPVTVFWQSLLKG